MSYAAIRARLRAVIGVATILKRREFGGKDYDDAVARLGLKQVFGRPVRPTPMTAAPSRKE